MAEHRGLIAWTRILHVSDQLPRGDVNENDVTVHYWASARSAAGIAEERVPAATLAELLVEISRRHLTLVTDGAGNFWAVNEGKNAAALNNYELPAGQRVPITPGVPVNICSYMLRIQPK